MIIAGQVAHVVSTPLTPTRRTVHLAVRAHADRARTRRSCSPTRDVLAPSAPTNRRLPRTQPAPGWRPEALSRRSRHRDVEVSPNRGSGQERTCRPRTNGSMPLAADSTARHSPGETPLKNPTHDARTTGADNSPDELRQDTDQRPLPARFPQTATDSSTWRAMSGSGRTTGTFHGMLSRSSTVAAHPQTLERPRKRTASIPPSHKSAHRARCSKVGHTSALTRTACATARPPGGHNRSTPG